MKDVNLPQLLENLKASWEDTCPDTEISVECDPITFRCFPYEIESIVNNLVANSTSAFKSVNQVERKIHIKVCQRDNFIDIFYQDNGPGLSTKYKKNPDLIMDAMETDKMDADGEIIGTGIFGATLRTTENPSRIQISGRAFWMRLKQSGETESPGQQRKSGLAHHVENRWRS